MRNGEWGMRASHSVMTLGTCGTCETGGTNVYWKLLMSEALKMALHIVNGQITGNERSYGIDLVLYQNN